MIGMLSNRPHRLISRVLLASLLAASAVPSVVFAQVSTRPVTRPVESDTQQMKKDRVETPDAANDTGSQPDGIVPSGGVELYQRMGAALPPAPPEKPYNGPLDEAFGAYQRGLFVTALDKALTRAGNGDAAAQTLVAEMMSKGQGVKRDAKTAAFWYGKAAAGGDPAAMFQYAMLLMSGRDVPRDKKQADDYMRKSADAGNSSAQFNWAQILVSDNPGDRGLHLALPFYEKAAAQGVADAQYAVAQLYIGLKDLPAAKKAEARMWLERAAKAGFDTAQLDMGIWLVNGVGGDQDYDKGFEWMRTAAMRGNVVAQNKLSHLYIEALGTRPNPVEAAKWYVLSRRAGLQDAMLEDFYLGINEETQKKAIEAANKFRRAATLVAPQPGQSIQ